MRLLRITAAWYEAGEYSLIKTGRRWAVAHARRDGSLVARLFGTKRAAATEIARRLTEDRTIS